MSSFRNLLLDLEISGQIVAVEWVDGQWSTGRIVKVGDDYLIMEVLGLSDGEGGVISMPVTPLHFIRCVNLRPVFLDNVGPGGECLVGDGDEEDGPDIACGA